MNTYSVFISFLFLLIAIFYYYKKHLFKLKNYSYQIGSSLDRNKKIYYYIAYQKKHGVYTNIKDLYSSYSWVLSKDILVFMNSRFSNDEEAENALSEFLSKIKKLN